ncbi:hypothetical protein FACS189451_09220 [Bacteroidia bacterium]|nr:hypothetical protein FACS189446_6150 [Bacteroidia bacterium]GHT63118.1 hypothetical protein FACS189451_09220 [Bacteroidia bacterium]
MQSETSKKIIERFFDALQVLKANKIIRGKQTFTKKYNINKGNFYQLEKNHERDIFQVGWLYILAIDYKVSPEWLLTGEGGFFQGDWDAGKVQTLQKRCM